jgi:hypothetical protein
MFQTLSLYLLVLLMAFALALMIGWGISLGVSVMNILFPTAMFAEAV